MARVTGIFAYIGHFEYTGRDLRLGMKEAPGPVRPSSRAVVFVRSVRQFSGRPQSFSCADLREIIQRKSWLSSLTKSSDTI